MLNNTLKVYDEDLINGSVGAASISSDKVVAAGSTQGALAVNVFAASEVKIGSTSLVVSVKHADSENGSFVEISKITVAQGTYTEGALMATMTLPAEVKAYVCADATSATGNSGTVRVTLGYLAR